MRRGRGAARLAALPLLTLALALASCGASHHRAPVPAGPERLPAADHPVPVGRGPRYRISPLSAAVSARHPVDGLRCLRAHPRQFGFHIELFAYRRVVPVSSGIGVAPPVRRRGVYVLSGACSYPLRTLEPTGVVRVDRGLRRLTLGVLFELWGQPLSRTRLAGFTGLVLAFLNGHHWPGSPRTIPLTRHAQIVLEIDGFLLPHSRYEFPPGL